MSGRKLREQCVSNPQNTVLIVCYERIPYANDTNDLELVGHAFATVWDYPGGTQSSISIVNSYVILPYAYSGQVGWVTQLVVKVGVRKRYIATSLLQMLKPVPLFHNITALGMVSSHPAACHALCKYTGNLICAHISIILKVYYLDYKIENVDLTFGQKHAKSILESSPVGYVNSMQLHGSLFKDNCTTGAISTVFTNFYVDHDEPLAALAEYNKKGQWCLGALLEGHEFLIIVPICNAIPVPVDIFA
jgi:hypothetical protein